MSSVKPFQEAELNSGDRWLYSAGFNVVNLNNTERIDEELNDLSALVKRGCKVSLISHQGSGKERDSRHLDFLVPYIQERLKVPVSYFADTDPEQMVKYSKTLNNGEICLFTNTRLFDGEKENSATLARVFSSLGEQVVIGGFSKLHRQHASNAGVLNILPAYLSTGVQREISTILPWSRQRQSPLSLAVLGGAKVEKLDPGLLGMLEFYDFIIPGGAVLNTLLYALGYDVGGSIAFTDSKLQKEIKSVFVDFGHKILLPRKLKIARGKQHSWLPLNGLKITDDTEIVDFELSSDMQLALEKVSACKGRILLSGPPSKNNDGHSNATQTLITHMNNSAAESIVLGGDSVAETQFNGCVSSGGGAALQFIAKGDFGAAYRPVIRDLACEVSP